MFSPPMQFRRAGSWQSARAISSNGGSNGRPNAKNNGLAAYADGMKGSYLGPRHTEDEIEKFLQLRQLPYEKYSRQELPAIEIFRPATHKVFEKLEG